MVLHEKRTCILADTIHCYGHCSLSMMYCFMKVGLAIEGGGMRGCVSAGMMATIYDLGLMDTFDAVYGSSAGSLVGAYAIAGQVAHDYCLVFWEISSIQ